MSIARQLPRKHIPAATDMNASMEELLELFSTWSVPKLYIEQISTVSRKEILTLTEATKQRTVKAVITWGKFWLSVTRAEQSRGTVTI
jgi:hypothetical protein